MKIPSVRFIFARKGLSQKTGKGAIEMVVTYQRTRKYMATGISVYPHNWKNDQVYGAGNDVEYNRILTTMRTKALKIIAEMLERGRLDVDAIPDLMRRGEVDMTFTDYVFKRIGERNVGENTHKSYVTLFNILCRYGKLKHFQDVNQRTLRDFSEWLHSYTWKVEDRYGKTVTRTYTQPTIYKITSNLSIFISDAVVDGYLSENPYVTKKMNEPKGGTRIEQYLTAAEVEKIEKAAMPTAALAESRDLFLMQCYTGMAYVDLMAHDFAELQEAEDMTLCTGTRKKTGTRYYFVVDEKARKILEKYNYHLPKLPNQKYNMRLKVVADAAGIEKVLTTHVGRRTAGSVWLNSGIPIEIVSRCLGHSSVAMTQRAYAQIIEPTILQAFQKIKKDTD